MKTLLVSGGFTYFTERMRQRFGYTWTRANTLAEHDGRLTGKVCGAIVDAVERSVCCASLPARSRRSPRQHRTRRRRQRFADASRGNARVAYHAKPKVREQVPVAINIGGMDTLLALLP